MERPSGDFSDGEQIFQWALVIRQRPNWIRVEIVSRLYCIADSSYYPVRHGGNPHRTETIKW